MRRAGLTEVLRALVHPQVGPIKHIHLLPVGMFEPALFVATAEFQDPYLLPPRSKGPPFVPDRYRPKPTRGLETFGAGVGMTLEAATWGAVGETLERLCTYIYDPGAITVAPGHRPADGFLDLNALILFSEEQYRDPTFPYVPAGFAQDIGWVAARSLRGEAERFVPASMVYFGYHFPDGELPYDASYSTGCACGGSREAAVLSGLLEVIERDAFACHWLSGRPGRVIRRDVHGDLLTDNSRYLTSLPGYRVDILDISSDIGIPVVVAIVKPEGEVGVAFGASARVDRGAAIEKALIEAFHSLNFLIDAHRADLPVPDAGDIRDFKDHLRHYVPAARQPALEFLRSGPLLDGPAATEAPEDDLAFVRSALERLGYEALYVPLEPPEISRLDLNVVKVVVPGLQPLSCGVGFEHRDPRRLSACAKRLGWEVSDYNLAPHPFP